jgi:hypothetical protein
LTALRSKSGELHVVSLEVELYSKLDRVCLRHWGRADRADGADRRGIANRCVRRREAGMIEDFEGVGVKLEPVPFLPDCIFL